MYIVYVFVHTCTHLCLQPKSLPLSPSHSHIPLSPSLLLPLPPSVSLFYPLSPSPALSHPLSLSLPLPLLPHPPSVQENASLTTELASRSKTLQEAQDHSTRLLSDLHRAKNAAKGSGGEGRGHAEKVTELEERLRQAEDDNLSLQVWVCVCMYTP